MANREEFCSRSNKQTKFKLKWNTAPKVPNSTQINQQTTHIHPHSNNQSFLQCNSPQSQPEKSDAKSIKRRPLCTAALHLISITRRLGSAESKRFVQIGFDRKQNFINLNSSFFLRFYSIRSAITLKYRKQRSLTLASKS